MCHVRVGVAEDPCVSDSPPPYPCAEQWRDAKKVLNKMYKTCGPDVLKYCQMVVTPLLKKKSSTGQAPAPAPAASTEAGAGAGGGKAKKGKKGKGKKK